MPTSSFGKIFVLNEHDAESFLRKIDESGFMLDPNFKSELVSVEDVKELLDLALNNSN